MKKIIKRVVAYDDLHLAQGEEVEADVEVEIRIDGETKQLDLTAAHAQQFRQDLALFMGVARVVKGPPKRKATYSRRPSGTPGLPVSRHPAAGIPREKVQDHLRAMREWAVARGRGNEFQYKGATARSGYSYGQPLVDDYNDWLASQGKLAQQLAG